MLLFKAYLGMSTTLLASIVLTLVFLFNFIHWFNMYSCGKEKNVDGKRCIIQA